MLAVAEVSLRKSKGSLCRGHYILSFESVRGFTHDPQRWTGRTTFSFPRAPCVSETIFEARQGFEAVHRLLFER